MKTIYKLNLLAAALLGAVVLTGCKSIGPGSVGPDRFDYSSSIAESWKQQVLLNIVKLRYLDLPVFVDVSSVVAGYSLQTGVTTSGTFSTEKAVQGNLPGGGRTSHLHRPAHHHLHAVDRAEVFAWIHDPD